MGRKIKRLVITTGALFLLAGSPIVQANPLGAYMNTLTNTITAQAAELPYSTHWETQADGNWKYKLTSGGYSTNAWVQDEVDLNWYVLDDNGIMRSGLFVSGGKYYLLSQLHDGHFGHMVKNGEVYNGITIQADTSAEYEGALSNKTISQLRNIGLLAEQAPDITGTQHVSDGQVTTPAGGNQTSTNNQGGGSTNNGSIYDGMAVDKNDKDQVDCDLNGDGKLTGIEYNSYRALKAMDGIEQPSQNDGVHIS